MSPHAPRPLVAAPLVAALVSTAACTAGPPDYPTLVDPPAAPRRPPGVALERRFVPPDLETRDPRTVVLVPPLDPADARRLVDAFFSAVRAEDIPSLDLLFAQGAVQQHASGRELRNAREYWRRRFARLDYEGLTEPVYRTEDVRIRRPEDGGEDPDGRLRPPATGELMLTLQPLTTHLQNLRVFGPELTFFVAEEDGRLVIARISEDFQLL